MKKYTKQEVLDQRISFKPMTLEQYNKLRKHFNIYHNKFSSDTYFRFYKDIELNCMHGINHRSYLLVDDSIKSTKEISFEEFDFEDEFVLPETWCIKNTKDNVKLLEEWSDRNEGNLGSTGIVSISGYLRYDKIWIPDKKSYTEITLDQFKKYVLKEEIKIMKDRVINYKQAQQIVDIACPQWTLKLAKVWSYAIVTKAEAIEVDEKFYQEMRKACTKDQHKLFDEIFGKDEPEFDSSMLKVGEIMVIKNDNNYHSSINGNRLIKTDNGALYNIDKNVLYTTGNKYIGTKIPSGIEYTIISK